ncbi:MAG: aspartyl/asparaginyl beta-hydroxylase domain-containing protein [Marinicaulis sp.]|nr:aspartyl/asparaginyl beta-hydroxylase domain-containing protein [Marinicaulis sp.]
MPSIHDHTPDEFLEEFRKGANDPPLALYTGAALAAAGRLEEAVAVWTIGEDADPIIRTIWLHPDAQGELKEHSRNADTLIRRHFTDMHRKTVDEMGGEELDRIRRGVWMQYATEPCSYRHEKQRPLIFYVPDLPARPVTPNDMLDWTGALEAAHGDILAEYSEAVKNDITQYPYVSEDITEPQWQTLRGKLDWSALYLHFNASETQEAKHFPKTLEALSSAPLVARDGTPLETFFSRLKPGAHIPPHCGLTNTRLTVHLPLIVPDDCEIRVADDIYKWTEGKITAFDDSFEHEAWNRSQEDRAVLIFETHHPDLKDAEIAAIEAVYARFDKWVSGRAEMLQLEIKEPANAT